MLKHVIGPTLLRSAFTAAILVFALCCSLQGTGQELPADDNPPPQGKNANDFFAELGRAVPGFAGMFIDEQRRDTLDVRVVSSDPDLAESDPGLAARLDAAIDAIPELASARAAQFHIKLLPARYSFLELKEWHDRVSGPLLALPGVVLTGIQQSSNRLLVGIDDWAVAADVTATLAHFDVPREAVNLESMQIPEEMPVEEGTSSAASPADPVTVQSKIRPLVGGIQIARKGALCTLGFIAERNKVAGFVTNSHCTEVPGGVENTMFYQPTIDDANKVAVESVDPCYFWNGPEPSFPPNCERIPKPIPMCGEKNACRYSDSAFATLENAVPMMLGYIARPTKTGTIDWDPPNTFFKIVGEQNLVLEKTPVYVSFEGRTTGWKEEVLSAVCTNSTITRKIGDKDQVYEYLCQNLATGAAGAGDFGDSGSPVFVCMDKKDPTKIVECSEAVVAGQANVNVKLVGIYWATRTTNTSYKRYRVFSPIGSITDGTVKGVQNTDNELGPLKKCAEGAC